MPFPVCEATGKECYANAEAKRVLGKLRTKNGDKADPIHVYRCPEGKRHAKHPFHIGHVPANKRKRHK